MGTIYTYPNNPRVAKAIAAANYGGLAIETPTFDFPGDAKKADYLAKFPTGKVPAFEGKDGFTLSESGAIAYYHHDIFPHVFNLSTPIFGWKQFNKQIHTQALEKVKAATLVLESHLLHSTFLVGERVTLADISVASAFKWGFENVLDKEFRKDIPNVIRWYQTCLNQGPVKSAFGEMILIDSAKKPAPAAKTDAPKKEKALPVAGAAAAAGAGAGAGAAAAAAPKSTKKAKAADLDEDDDEPRPEPKPKNPLDSLPPSSLILDEWKRKYSNEDTRPVALPWFWEHFDAQGYSLWRLDYKYNDELTQIFMSSNLIGGFFARLEASRKYLFGNMGVFGKSNASVISGAFIARGHDAKVFEVAPDYESYSIVRLDPNRAEDKAFFDDMSAWEAVVEGKEWADGKTFK